MKMNVYSIKDVKVGYMQPFYQANNAVAIRAFTNAVNDEKVNNINQNADDMELWLLGQFNDETGVIESNVQFLCKANDVKRGV